MHHANKYSVKPGLAVATWRGCAADNCYLQGIHTWLSLQNGFSVQLALRMLLVSSNVAGQFLLLPSAVLERAMHPLMVWHTPAQESMPTLAVV